MGFTEGSITQPFRVQRRQTGEQRPCAGVMLVTDCAADSEAKALVALILDDVMGAPDIGYGSCQRCA